MLSGLLRRLVLLHLLLFLDVSLVHLLRLLLVLLFHLLFLLLVRVLAFQVLVLLLLLLLELVAFLVLAGIDLLLLLLVFLILLRVSCVRVCGALVVPEFVRVHGFCSAVRRCFVVTACFLRRHDTFPIVEFSRTSRRSNWWDTVIRRRAHFRI